MHPKPQQEALEEVEEGLQPGTLKVGVHQDLSLLAKREGVGGVHKVHQIQVHGDSSMEDVPAEVPGGSWDQGRIQTCPLGTLTSALT